MQSGDNEVVQALLGGKSIHAVAMDFGIGDGTVSAIRKRAEKNGVAFPVLKAGRPKKTENESPE